MGEEGEMLLNLFERTQYFDILGKKTSAPLLFLLSPQFKK